MLKNNNKKGYIYKLTDGENDYYGSCLDIRERKYGHNSPANDCASNKLNMAKAEIKVMEELDDITDHLDPILLWRERYYIDNFKCVNKVRPITTEKEKQEYKKEYKKKYDEKNKESLLKYHQEYRLENKEYYKKYYKKNKESVQKYHQEYRKENKEFIKRRVCCRCCKCELSMDYWRNHTKTAKHIKNSLDSV